MKPLKRTYSGEMAWALIEIYAASSDIDREKGLAKIKIASEYGVSVAVARDEKGPIPSRPYMNRVV